MRYRDLRPTSIYSAYLIVTHKGRTSFELVHLPQNIFRRFRSNDWRSDRFISYLICMNVHLCKWTKMLVSQLICLHKSFLAFLNFTTPLFSKCMSQRRPLIERTHFIIEWPDVCLRKAYTGKVLSTSRQVKSTAKIFYDSCIFSLPNTSR